MPKVSWMILASGARQLVVHEALETTAPTSLLYSVLFTPMTYIGVASLLGALMMTFLHPPWTWAPAFSAVVKTLPDTGGVQSEVAVSGRSQVSMYTYFATLNSHL